ncbi:MAG: PhzF family phenazine biosynthesis protein [Azoarcus sp.]|nr:PhzF family phenazine biosynthesis protein [Azoarcus sp.]
MQADHEATKIDVHVIHSFISERSGGNPAGVVLDADSLSETEMQSVAAHLGLSEIAFVSRAAGGAFRLDFFTPNRRIAHCGHATIAAFSRLAELGRVSEGWTSKETIDGSRRILIRDGLAYMEQTAPRYLRPDAWAKGISVGDVLRSLGLADVNLDTRTVPMVVSTGNSFLLLSVERAQTLARIVPDHDAVAAISEILDLIGYYVFTTEVATPHRDATTRMFAPRFAIPEEAATGMAAGPLACLLHDHMGIAKRQYHIEQGVLMPEPSPSLITVQLDIRDGRIRGLMVGGRAQLVQSRTVEIGPTGSLSA